MTGVLLATESAEFEARVNSAFEGSLNGDLCRASADLSSCSAAVVAQLAAAEPDVVALGPGISVPVALEIARQLDVGHPQISVVLVAEPSVELYEMAMRVGTREIIAPEASGPDLRHALERALGAAQRRRSGREEAPTEPSRGAGRVIVVSSPKGGSGKTVLASNLAVVLTSQAPGQVVLVDLDLQFGDAATALRLVADHSIADAVSAPTIDSSGVKASLARHHTGLYVLCAPDNPVDADSVASEQVAALLRLLSSEFAYVIVDTPGGLDEHTLAAIEQATDLILLSSTDVPSVRATRKELDALDLIGVNRPRRFFVLNRADARVGLSTGDIEQTIGMKISCALPSSRSVPVALNQGRPLAECDPKSAVARAVVELAGCFAKQTHAGFGRRRRMTS